jgi:hypothetical protein
MSGSCEPTKKKRLVLNAKFTSELKTELAFEAAGTERALISGGVAASSSLVVAAKREEKPPPVARAAPVAVALVPKQKEEEDWMDCGEDEPDDLPALATLSVAEGDHDDEVLPFDRPVVFQMGSDALEGSAKLVRFQSGAMALVVGEKTYMLERGMPSCGNNQLIGRLNVATRELSLGSNVEFGRQVVLSCEHSDS